jgi:uncharacterized delta-60 repeat protein
MVLALFPVWTQAQIYSVTTLAGSTAGSGSSSGNVDATGAAARFNGPLGISVDSAGTVYVADFNNQSVRKITPLGAVTTLGTYNQSAIGVFPDGSGGVYTAHGGAQVLGRFTASGVFSIYAGALFQAGGTDGALLDARFNGPHALARDSAGNFYVSDSLGHAIRKISSTGMVTTLAGLAGTAGAVDGTGAAARFNGPTGIGVDGNGNVYVAEYLNHTIRKITPSGVVTTLAGAFNFSGSANGTGGAARFSSPIGLAVEPSGVVYVSELGGLTIRKITTGGNVTTIAGQYQQYGTTDGIGSTARFNYPYAMAVDTAGALYIADAGSNNIRKATPVAAPATMNLSPLSQIVTAGGTVTWSAVPSNGGNYSYQWRLNGRAITGATNASLVVSNVTLAQRGAYEIVATNGGETLRGVAMLEVAPGAGMVVAWGDNEYGQATVPDGLGSLVGMAAGDHHSLAIKADRTVVGWGLGGNGELDFPAGLGAVVAVAAGNTHSVALRADGTVAVWGGSLDGQTLVPAAAFNVVAIATGAHHVLALRSDGRVVAWGNNTLGQATVPANLTDVIGIAAGAWCSFAVKADGTVAAWGRNDFGETNFPAGPTGAFAVQGGDTHGVAVLSDRTAVAWGSAPAGAGSVPAGLTNIAAISAGGYHNLALKLDGTITAWGANSFNQASGPASATQVYAVAGGQFYSLALVPLVGPTVITQPVTVVAGPGEVATFTVGATGAGTLSFQWQKNGVNLANGSRIFGVNTSTLTLTSLQGDDAANYRVVVKDDTGQTNSVAVPLTVSATVYQFSTFAGMAGVSGTADGVGDGARFAGPYGLTCRGGALYVADSSAATIRKITTSGVVTTLAGVAGARGQVDGPPSVARFDSLFSVAMDSVGELLTVTDGHTIRQVSTGGFVTTLAGLSGAPGAADGTRSNARFRQPQGVAVDRNGNVFVADTLNHSVRKVTPLGVVTTIAGSLGEVGSADGVGTAARFSYPVGITIDGADNLYVVETGNVDVRKITPAGVVSTIAGQPGSFGSADGVGSTARFMGGFGVVADTTGNLFVADTNAETVRKIIGGNIVRTIGGVAAQRGSQDGIGSGARFFNPASVAVTLIGTIFVADAQNHTIRLGVPMVADFRPVITQQPAPVDASVGASVTFTVAAVGNPAPAFQWQRKPAGGSAFSNLLPSAQYTGVTSATLGVTIPGTVVSGDQFRCLVLNTAGSLFSAAATLTVASPITISTPPANVAVTAGQAAAFSVSATADSSLSYQWRRDGVPISGATGASLGFGSTHVWDSGAIDVVISAGANSVTSPAAVLTVAPTRYPTTMHIDPTFTPLIEAIGGTVFSLVAQPDGKLLVGGDFSAVGTVARRNLARLNADGTLDASFNPGTGPDNVVEAMLLQADGKLIIAGRFTRYNGVNRGYVARLNADGSLDASFDTSVGANNFVNALALGADGAVFIGGAFTSLNGSTCNRLARLDSNGRQVTSFNVGAGPDSEVTALALQTDGKLIVAGYFSHYGAAAQIRIARVDGYGALDPTFSSPLASSYLVNCVALQADGKVLVGGGDYQTSGPKLHRLNVNGTRDFTFLSGSGPNNEVYGIAVQPDGRILIGGWFSFYNGQFRNRIARLNPDGSVDDYVPATSDLSSYVRTVIRMPDGKLAAGGQLSSAVNSALLSGIIRLLTTGERDPGFTPELRVPGSLSELIQQPDGRLLITGTFNYIDGTTRNQVARLLSSGALDSTFNPGAGLDRDGVVMSLQPDGKVLLGGFFNTYDGVARSRIVRTTATGSLDPTFSAGSGPNYGLTAMELQADGKILIGGAFDSVAGVSRAHVARLNANGSLDTAFNPGAGADHWVFKIVLPPDGHPLLGGWFNNYDGISRSGVVRVLTNGALDPDFDPGSGAGFGVETALRLPDGRILVGGSFFSFAGAPRAGIVRLQGGGALDPSFVPPSTSPVGDVGTIMSQADGKVYIGQEVNSGGPTVAGLARLTTSGAVDPTFSVPGLLDAKIARMILLDDGRMLLAGSKFNDGFQEQFALARLAHLDPPTILTPPVEQFVAVGGAVTLGVSATGGALRYQWNFEGAPINGATNASLSLTNLTSTATGYYSVTVSNPLGSTTTTPVKLIVSSRSLRAVTGMAPSLLGADGMTASFTVEGTAKRLLVRAVGPTLQTLGVTGVLLDPRLEIVNVTTGAAVAANDDWGAAPNASEISAASAAAGAFPLSPGAKDAVVLATFAPGTYQARVAGPGTTTGIVLLEIYEADTNVRLAYVAVRAQAGTGALTGGIIVDDLIPGRNYLVRALGPTLAGPGVLADPQLQISRNSTVVASNDDWLNDATISAAVTAVGAMPLPIASRDAAFLFTPTASGAYTFLVNGKDGGTGRVLVEVFEVDAQRSASIPAALVSPPENVTADAGDPARLAVVTVGKPTPSYQWRQNGTEIAGATRAALEFKSALPTDAGDYDVVVTNSGGLVSSSPVHLTVNAVNRATHALVGRGYIAGSTASVENTLHYIGPASGLTWSVALPAGWSLASENSTAATKPAPGATGALTWTWTSGAANPVVFSYTLTVPANETGAHALAATVQISAGGITNLVVVPDPLTLVPLVTHSADINRDCRLTLIELTRVIELYNTRNGASRTGCYGVAITTTEDGFMPEPTRAGTTAATLARYHSTDSNRDGKISLLELTRMIELYNYRTGTTRTGQYHAQSGTEDGFEPGP